MGISKNILIAFVFTIFFIVSNTDFEDQCYPEQLCAPNDGICEHWCASMSIPLVGECVSGKCCCLSKRPN
ncbi:hypothetical protein IGI04_013860 [Brassica rapa subsp. trilocularis]|uniref:Uncharacterized protein n=1 Tax=Brassica rapa subsp. trilocularis TaxID=1813537 RepID=A0ABQ7NBY6_BRACM|nr:hypothetical protein IGI04_013860 [Brassica rapa subsp. trilocularis]